MGRSDEPDNQEVMGDAREIREEDPEGQFNEEGEEGYDEIRELDEGFVDEREISTVNDALDNISQALDKLEEQNDQLNEQLRSILAASERIKSGMDSVNSFGTSSSNSGQA